MFGITKFKNWQHLVLALTLALFVSGCGTAGIKHSNVVEPTYPTVMVSKDIAKIGIITSLKELNGILYVGAREGLGALDTSGKALWTLSLPKADMRLIDADENNVAFTSYIKTGKESESAGELGARLAVAAGLGGSIVAVSNASVGLATTQGALVWSSDSSEQSQLSPPALSKNAVGVTRALTFALYNRTKGNEISQIGFHQTLMGMDVTSESLMKTGPIIHPVVLNNMFYVGHTNFIKEIDESGKELQAHTQYGLFTPILQVTAGPMVYKEKIVFTGQSSLPTIIFAVDKDIDKVWDEKIKNEFCGSTADCYEGKKTFGIPNSLASNTNNIFVAAYNSLSSYTENGSLNWMDRNDGGGLYDGYYRYVGSPGTQMVATDKYVYITSAYHKGDALTVLDAESGKYVNSLDMKTKILDMAKFGSNLALATEDGLKFIELK